MTISFSALQEERRNEKVWIPSYLKFQQETTLSQWFSFHWNKYMYGRPFISQLHFSTAGCLQNYIYLWLWKYPAEQGNPNDENFEKCIKCAVISQWVVDLVNQIRGVESK